MKPVLEILSADPEGIGEDRGFAASLGNFIRGIFIEKMVAPGYKPGVNIVDIEIAETPVMDTEVQCRTGSIPEIGV